MSLAGPGTHSISPGALGSVPETALITLYNRGSESQRPDRLIEDDLAAELLASIDYPFAERFGRPDLSHVVAHFEA